MIKELCKDEAILSKRCERATAQDAPVAQDLVDTMHSLEDCGCLAANQIGVTKAVVVFQDDSGADHVMYNPRIMKVKVSFDELVDGELKPRRRDYTGFEAQMIQHMCDHCQGKLV